MNVCEHARALLPLTERPDVRVGGLVAWCEAGDPLALRLLPSSVAALDGWAPRRVRRLA